jgi:hypothetical protein
MAAAIGLRAWTLDANDYEDEAAFRRQWLTSWPRRST